MAESISLLLAMHCHQPVGNFGFVFEDAYAKAYEPFLEVLERHPGVRLTLHYSGCLLDWLMEYRPQFLDRVRMLVQRGQVELLASGYYEPILPMLPEADRQGQVRRMRELLRTRFGSDAEGLWLTERVWEPELPTTLARAGIRYTMVDTNQFAPAQERVPSALQVRDDAFWDVLGCYEVQHEGSAVLLFPASKRLRYWMPFQPVAQTMDFLRGLRRDGGPAITFADDGEKFGLWPKTFQWVYREGWLDQCFTALERESSWLTTMTFREYVRQVGPSGRVTLPSGSYEEMLEWSGGRFQNFFTKYPEADAMRQKMLRVSHAVRALKPPAHARGTPQVSAADRRSTLIRRAQQELYTGQCNCAYWHGVFGGLYLSHLRRAVYAHLIAAEALAQQAAGRAMPVIRLDADGDGREELRLANSMMSLIVDPDEGGTVTDWSLYDPPLNLLDTLTRRPEPYHEKLKAVPPASAAPPESAPASIHDALGVKEAHLASRLVYDDHRRSAFLDYGLRSMPSLEEVVRSAWGVQRLWSAGVFQTEDPSPRARSHAQPSVSLMREESGGWIRKTIRAAAARPTLELGYELNGVCAPVVGVELNVSLRDPRFLAQPQQWIESRGLVLEEPEAGVSLTLSIDPPTRLFAFPIETVSESEGGLERTYQGLCLMCLWTVADVRSWKAQLQLAVQTHGTHQLGAEATRTVREAPAAGTRSRRQGSRRPWRKGRASMAGKR